MAKKRAYDEVSVVRSLSKKNSISINTVNMTINVLKDSPEVGNGSWGKIDYLRKVHGYVVVFVKSINKRPAQPQQEDDNVGAVNTKSAKREAKLNMVSMVKSTMRKVKTK
jgi:hypothetical protein